MPLEKSWFFGTRNSGWSELISLLYWEKSTASSNPQTAPSSLHRNYLTTSLHVLTAYLKWSLQMFYHHMPTKKKKLVNEPYKATFMCISLVFKPQRPQAYVLFIQRRLSWQKVLNLSVSLEKLLITYLNTIIPAYRNSIPL
jgi:hypothetical protein